MECSLVKIEKNACQELKFGLEPEWREITAEPPAEFWGKSISGRVVFSAVPTRKERDGYVRRIGKIELEQTTLGRSR